MFLIFYLHMSKKSIKDSPRNPASTNFYLPIFCLIAFDSTFDFIVGCRSKGIVLPSTNWVVEVGSAIALSKILVISYIRLDWKSTPILSGKG